MLDTVHSVTITPEGGILVDAGTTFEIDMRVMQFIGTQGRAVRLGAFGAWVRTDAAVPNPYASAVSLANGGGELEGTMVIYSYNGELLDAYQARRISHMLHLAVHRPVRFYEAAYAMHKARTSLLTSIDLLSL